MKNIYLLLLACFAFSRCCSQDPAAATTEDQIRQVENSLSGDIKFDGSSGYNLADRMKFYKVEGLSIAVIQDFHVAWAKGYGWADEKEGRRVTEKTLFMAASVSKSVNSAGVMKLVQDGKLDLTRDINEYLVTWKYPYDSVSGGRKISTMNLLTHTAGINDGAPAWIAREQIPSIRETLNGVMGSAYVYSDAQRTHSVTAPGLAFQYSNNGVAITQVLISDITGKEYEQYMHESLFVPLGMNYSCYSEQSLHQHAGSVATGYTYGYEVPGKHIITPFQAAGGLWTTPSDMAQIIIEVQKAYAGQPSKILTRQSARTMLTPFKDAAPGFFLEQPMPGGARYFTHSGITRGFRSVFYGSMEGGNGVVVMINSDRTSGDILTEVIHSIATVYGWKDFYKPEIRKKPVEVPRQLLARCEGVYAFDDRYFIILQQADGGHIWSGWRDDLMHFTATKEFYNENSQTNKSLVFDISGNVTGIRRFLDGQELSQAVRVSDPGSSTLNKDQVAEIAWHLLESGRFDSAQLYYRRLEALDPGDLMSRCNAAHCKLFLDEYDNALNAYMDIKDKSTGAGTTFAQTILDDFEYFKKCGFDAHLMNRVVKDMQLESQGE